MATLTATKAQLPLAAEVSNDSGNDFDSMSHIYYPLFNQDGVAGVDFPNHTDIPHGIQFSCRSRIPGLYANPQADCQVYHQCLPDGRIYNFLCGVGTVFNQRSLICDHWYNYDCNEAEEDYKYNAILFGAVSQHDTNRVETYRKTSEFPQTWGSIDDGQLDDGQIHQKT